MQLVVKRGQVIPLEFEISRERTINYYNINLCCLRIFKALGVYLIVIINSYTMRLHVEIIDQLNL